MFLVNLIYRLRSFAYSLIFDPEQKTSTDSVVVNFSQNTKRVHDRMYVMNDGFYSCVHSSTLLLTAMLVAFSSHAQTGASGAAAQASLRAGGPASANMAAGDIPNAVSAGAPVPAQNALVAPSLEISNVFDSQRKMWPDRVPPVPPPPPPPPPAPVSDGDLQLYGVVIVGQVKRATVKIGPRFASIAPVGRAFTNLVEGQVLGEFTVAQITPTHVALSAPGGQQLVYFTKKSDRSATNSIAAAPSSVQPVQGAIDAASNSSQNTSSGQSGVAEPASLPGSANALTAKNPTSSSAPTGSPPKESAPAPPPVDIQNSLAAAIAAAKENTANRPAGPTSLNPFMQKP